MVVKVGLLTYEHLHELGSEAKSHIDDPEIELVLVEGLMHELVDKVRTLRRTNKVEVFLGGGANGRYVKEHADVPVKIIEFGLFEILTAMSKARKLGKRIGIAAYMDARCHIELLRDVLTADVVEIPFRDESDLRRNLLAAGVDVVIGASLANKVAGEAGIPSVLIYPGPESIAAAVKDAKLMALEIRREKERRRLFQAVLEYSWGGVIATDREGLVIAYNPSAERLLGVPRTEVMGKPLAQLFPDIGRTEPTTSLRPQIGHIREVNGVKAVVNRIPVVVNDEAAGSVMTFRKVSELQTAENRIRTRLVDRGLRARARFDDILGGSPAMRALVDQARLFASCPLNVYIFGETGVGKEMFAQSIHNESAYADGPFVAVNCAALPESLLESELFGYEEGAFTGSRKGGKMGLFEMAHRGTIFLDEVTEIPAHIQARLLRVLQEKEVMRIGGDRIVPIDVRIISASNRQARDGVVAGTFREDLYYRLNVLQLDIPPLRERTDDVEELFFHFLRERHGHVHAWFAPQRDAVQDVLARYAWPGNTREIQNVVERMHILAHQSTRRSAEDCRQLLLKAIGKGVFIDDYVSRNGGREQIVRNETQLRDLCDIFRGQTELVAQHLGISRTTLWRRRGER